MLPVDLIAIMAIRIVVHFALSCILLVKWSRSEKKYLTDFPFLFGVIFMTPAISKTFDLYLGNAFARDDTGTLFFNLMRVRYAITAVNLVFLLVALLVIWFRDKRKVQSAILGGYIAAWVVMLAVAPDYDTLSNALPWLVTPLTILVIATFAFIHAQKRLQSQFNALVVAIGTLIYAVGSVLYPVLTGTGTTGWGYGSIAEVVNLAGWTIMFLGFVKIKRPLKRKQEVLLQS